MSSLAEITDPTPNSGKARANRDRQREKRRLEQLAMMTYARLTSTLEVQPDELPRVSTRQWTTNEAAYPVVAIYCGAPVEHGCSYCARHAAIAFAR
jgi:hypothetical protein